MRPRSMSRSARLLLATCAALCLPGALEAAAPTFTKRPTTSPNSARFYKSQSAAVWI